MVISRRAVRDGFVAVAVAGSLALGVVGCSGGDGAAKENDKAVEAAQLCGGNALSADAAEGVEVITGSSRFDAPAEESTVARAASSLSEAFASSAADDG
ncbi:hypothetical protein G3M58_33565, partial [Streptomyces sp. SID7499]|nr:hypothetical protein [Streptomyces sp. SID7499]